VFYSSLNYDGPRTKAFTILDDTLRDVETEVLDDTLRETLAEA